MTTRRLLWGMTWRGAVWGVAIGLLFFAIFQLGYMLINSIPVLRAILESLWHVYGTELTLDQVILLHILGILNIAGTLGFVLKIALGILGGLGIGIYTRMFYRPSANLAQYRHALTIKSGIVGFVWEFAGTLS